MTDAMSYEVEGIKPSKAKNIKATSKKQAVKGLDQVNALTLQWVLFKRTVKFLWTNKVPITVNLFFVENVILLQRHFHLFFK